jgi:hypothetical protein
MWPSLLKRLLGRMLKSTPPYSLHGKIVVLENSLFKLQSR